MKKEKGVNIVKFLEMIFKIGEVLSIDIVEVFSGDPYGIRTRVAAVKGRCPKPLDEGAIVV